MSKQEEQKGNKFSHNSLPFQYKEEDDPGLFFVVWPATTVHADLPSHTGHVTLAFKLNLQLTRILTTTSSKKN